MRGGALSDNTLSKLLRELGIEGRTAWIPNQSFRTWCGDTEQNREAAEAALAHVVKKQGGSRLCKIRLARRAARHDAGMVRITSGQDE